MAEFQYLNQGNTEVQDKQAEAYLWAPSGTTGIAATGVIAGLVVRQTTTPSGSVLIGAGTGVDQASLGQGADRLVNPSEKTLDIFTANPMGGLPRNDIVVFDSITTAIIAITGTPNATPTDPTVPATSVALGRLRHAASATTIPQAKIDDLRVITTLRGIPIPHDDATQTLLYTPVGNLTTPSSGTATWMALGNITVPSWATKCAVIYAINGIYEIAAAANAAVVMKIGTVAGAVSKRIFTPSSTSPSWVGDRGNLPVVDTLTGLTGGVQSVTLFATWVAGSGAVRADTASYVTAQFTFQP